MDHGEGSGGQKGQCCQKQQSASASAGKELVEWCQLLEMLLQLIVVVQTEKVAVGYGGKSRVEGEIICHSSLLSTKGLAVAKSDRIHPSEVRQAFFDGRRQYK